MKNALRIALLITAIGLLQNTLSQTWPPLGWVDGLMMITGFLALRLPFVPAVLTGAFAGLIQDILGGGLIGLHAFAKTAVASVYGSAGSVLVVRGQLAEALVIGVGTFVEGTIGRTLLLFLGWPGAELGGQLAARGAVTAVVMGLLLVVVPRTRMAWANRRRGRRMYAR